MQGVYLLSVSRLLRSRPVLHSRPLIKAMVECLRPEPGKTIADPACGTGGFFLAAYDYLSAKKLDKEQAKFLKYNTFFGNEIVASTRRLALMNLFLHNIGDYRQRQFHIICRCTDSRYRTAVRLRVSQSSFRQEKQHDVHQRRW